MTDPQQQAMPPLPEPDLRGIDAAAWSEWQTFRGFNRDALLVQVSDLPKIIARALAASSQACQSKKPHDSRPDQSCADLTCGFVGGCSRKGGEAPGCVVPEGWKLVPHPITEEMHAAACKVLLRAAGLDGLSQRMLDAMLSASPSVAEAGEEKRKFLEACAAPQPHDGPMVDRLREIARDELGADRTIKEDLKVGSDKVATIKDSLKVGAQR